MPDATPAYDYRRSSLDEDRRRARDVEQRVARARRAERKERDRPAAGEEAQEGERGEDDAAARAIQGRYRSHVQRREKAGCNLSASQRWSSGIQQRRMSAAAKEQDDGKNDPTSRWRRGQIYAAKLTEGKPGGADDGTDGELSAEDEMELLGRNDKEKKRIEQERTAAKTMEGQYYLELVDRKHRYASNLKYYHQRWNETDTNDNFFHWLDEGEGKGLDLEQCPRRRLESERITYLNAEQREVYRVVVNKEGLLVWAKDGTHLDTSKYHEDRGPEHGGIVEISEEEYAERRKKESEKLKEMQDRGEVDSDLSRSSSSSSSSSDEADEIREGVHPYSDKGGTAGQGKGIRQAKARVKYYLSPSAVMDNLLRKTINKNTWLYVSDLQNNLYVGIKKTGSFQHSSFLYGARVTSAGLIKASHGHLTSLSPLSGHYRAGTMHFKAFVRSLEEQGVDMFRVSISKSVMTIRGIEKYGALSKKKKALTARIKGVFTHAPSDEQKQADTDRADVRRIRKQEADEGAGAHEREVTDGEDRMRRENEEDEEPLPGEGKKPEEMTEEERMERGVALVQRAFERGLSFQREKGQKEEKDEGK
ncbi:hypothetical protein JCM10450v2_001402 [Rhodotorula kratochvilovae]